MVLTDAQAAAAYRAAQKAANFDPATGCCCGSCNTCSPVAALKCKVLGPSCGAKAGCCANCCGFMCKWYWILNVWAFCISMAFTALACLCMCVGACLGGLKEGGEKEESLLEFNKPQKVEETPTVDDLTDDQYHSLKFGRGKLGDENV